MDGEGYCGERSLRVRTAGLIRSGIVIVIVVWVEVVLLLLVTRWENARGQK